MRYVKNTMPVSISDLLAPHYCCSCGKIGAILCEYCKYNIISDTYGACVVCCRPTDQAMNLCRACDPPYSRAWCVGERSAELKQLIDGYKFSRARAAHRILAELLDETLPLFRDVVVVPLPTVASHKRQRGYGHIELIARDFARRRGLPYREMLTRNTDTTQHGASRRVRDAQAAKAFSARSCEGTRCLLIDDVYTTGATMKYAARALREAGADDVWIAVISRQPLDK